MAGESIRPLIRKAFPGYILTYAISSLGGCISSLADSLVVSNLMSPNDLAAIGLISPYYTILSMLGAFFYTGTQIQCSRALGSGEKEKSDQWFSMTVEAVLVLSAVMVLLCYIFSRQIAVEMGASPDHPELLECVTAFNNGFFLNIPFSLLNAVLVMSTNVDGNKRLVSLSVTVTVVVDIIGNLLSVTVFHAGIFGIALSTTVATFSADVVLILHIIRGKSAFRLKFTPLSLRMLTESWKHGMPKLSNKLLVIVSSMLMNRLLVRTGGTVAMGAMSVLGSLCHILLTPSTGICSTAFLMTGAYYGEGDNDSLREIYRCVLFYALIGVGLFAAVVFVLASPIVRIFIRDPGELYDCTVRALRIYAFSLPLNGLAEGLFGYVQGSGKKKFAIAFTFITQIGRMAVMYVLTALIGTDGVWYSYLFGVLIGLIICQCVILLTERGENASLTDRLLLISSSAREAESNSLYASVKNESDPPLLAQKVQCFCRERGVDPKRAFYAALCCEEMTKNVVQHGFHEQKKNDCSVHLLLRKEDMILRIRDNCEFFNTEEYFRQHPEAEDGFSNIGIRLTCSVAKDVQYVQMLKANTLIIRI